MRFAPTWDWKRKNVYIDEKLIFLIENDVDSKCFFLTNQQEVVLENQFFLVLIQRDQLFKKFIIL